MAIASKLAGEKKIDSEGYLNRRRFSLAGGARGPPISEKNDRNTRDSLFPHARVARSAYSKPATLVYVRFGVNVVNPGARDPLGALEMI